MDIDLDKLEAAARAATPGVWTIGDEDMEATRIVTDAELPEQDLQHSYGDQTVIGSSEWTFCRDRDATFITAANPAVVLELVLRLKAAEQKLAALRPLTIGNTNGDATLFGSQEEVMAFQSKMRENIDIANQVAVEECIAEKIEALKGVERYSVDEIAEIAGYSSNNFIYPSDVEKLLGVPPVPEKPRRPWAEVTGKGKVYKPS